MSFLVRKKVWWHQLCCQKKAVVALVFWLEKRCGGISFLARTKGVVAFAFWTRVVLDQLDLKYAYRKCHSNDSSAIKDINFGARNN